MADAATIWSAEAAGCRLVERVVSREFEQAHVVRGDLRIGTVRYYPLTEWYLAVPAGGLVSRGLNTLEEAIAWIERFAEDSE